LKAGDRVEIKYESDEEGVSAIRSIRLLPPAKPTSGAADVSTGTVLVLDRKARVLVLTDRTVWALNVMKSALPTGLKAGDRVEIDYESDEEGVSAINSITIL
jgi:cold shock CspA family protein